MSPPPAALRVGTEVHVELGDHDALDPYTFRILDVSDEGLRVGWQMSSSTTDAGELTFTAGALDGARSFVRMSQGNVDLDPEDTPERIERAMPPFLLSRAAFAELEAGALTLSTEAGDQHCRRTGAGSRALAIAGETRTVPTLVAESESLRLEVVDDPSMPLVVSRTEWGEVQVALQRTT